MRIAVLCNGEDLALWQHRAIEQIAGQHELFVVACGDQPAPRRRFQHYIYYALNLVTVRNRLTRRIPFPGSDLRIKDRIEIQPNYNGNWAELSDGAVQWLKAKRIDAIIKFGLGLLRVPAEEELPIPILSYHHGDPRSYRGRPAGFWELANGASLVGQVVQILSNDLDSGKVVAFAESRAVPHSYRQTLIEAYALSPHLLPMALSAIASGSIIDMDPSGRNFRLPDNWAVVRFITRRWLALGHRLVYGAFIEKKWRVATAEASALDPVAAIQAAERRAWIVPTVADRYTFYADPFFHSSADDILVEALNRWSGKGQIVRIRGGRQESIAGGKGHLSYPVSVEEDGERYIVPEISDWSPAAIFSLDGTRVTWVADLNIVDRHLIDPTPFHHDGQLYLFANTTGDGPSVLHLWVAPSLFGRFERHPASPIRVSARGSRMAGKVGLWGNQLYRLGQDGGRGYGDGLLAFRVLELSPTTYRERLEGDAAFQSVRGPHTANLWGDRLLFDFYRERFSLFAGFRRLMSRF
jgi:hypothetical protein